MSGLDVDSPQHFATLRERIRQSVEAGNLSRALEDCREAVVWAREYGTRREIDLALCSRAEIQIQQGDGQQAVRDLRKILLGSSCPENSFRAAYSVSEHHRQVGENERSLFYARLALSHAAKADDPRLEASARHQVGLLEGSDSYFGEASENLQRALSLFPKSCRMERAMCLSSLGYCQVLLGELEIGLENLFESLRRFHALGAEAVTRFPHAGISHAYLESEEIPLARCHAAASLRLCREAGTPVEVKNALYLLGEAEKLSHNEDEAFEVFQELQRRFYPDEPHIIDYLMATDCRKLINLMA